MQNVPTKESDECSEDKGRNLTQCWWGDNEGLTATPRCSLETLSGWVCLGFCFAKLQYKLKKRSICTFSNACTAARVDRWVAGAHTSTEDIYIIDKVDPVIQSHSNNVKCIKATTEKVI